LKDVFAVQAEIATSVANALKATLFGGAIEATDKPPGGSLAAYRAGQLVPPVPDGTCDVTAHVALDAVALAGEAAGAVGTVLTSQQTALRALGVSADRPDPASARDDPAGYLSRLQAAGEAAELLDPGGLGGFGWLVQSRGPAVPDAWAGFDSTPPGSRR
jgi:SAM-dependent MidA family methyltransferase